MWELKGAGGCGWTRFVVEEMAEAAEESFTAEEMAEDITTLIAVSDQQGNYKVHITPHARSTPGLNCRGKQL
jgi:hypothetical protein